jgi:hypothetical protein
LNGRDKIAGWQDDYHDLLRIVACPIWVTLNIVFNGRDVAGGIAFSNDGL